MTKDMEMEIAAGEQKMISMDLPLSQELNRKEITVELSVSQRKLTTENNTVSTEIHSIDLAVAQASVSLTENKELLITGTLVNKGLEDITNIHTGIYHSTLTGEKLDEIVTDTIKAGETVTFQSTLPGDMMYQDDTKQLNALMIYTESDSEERNYANNEVRVVFDAKGQQLNSGKNEDENDENNPNLGGGNTPGGDNQNTGDIENTLGGGDQNPGDTGTNPGGDNSDSEDNGDGTIIKAAKITISAPSKKIAAGKKVQLTAKVTPKNTTNQKVTWKSGNKKYATVNSKGKVTAKKAGKGKTVTITVASTDGTNKKAKVKIKIK